MTFGTIKAHIKEIQLFNCKYDMCYIYSKTFLGDKCPGGDRVAIKTKENRTNGSGSLEKLSPPCRSALTQHNCSILQQLPSTCTLYKRLSTKTQHFRTIF